MLERRVVFRADASVDIGTGHIMRCLTLAEALVQRGFICEFITRQHDGNLIDLVRARGFSVDVLPLRNVTESKPYSSWLGANAEVDANDVKHVIGEKKVEWLIADHYAIDEEWENLVRPSVAKLMVIDDLANRNHTCELLLDQNFGRITSDYSNLVPNSARIFTGSEFALLRPEFSRMRKQSLLRRNNFAGAIREILVNMGGIDKSNVTSKILTTLKQCDLSNVRVTVVMGKQSLWVNEVRSLTEQLPFETSVITNSSEMALLMSESDLAIGAAGSTSWERCCLGLPSFLVVLADNQEQICRTLAAHGAAFSLGWPKDISSTLPKLLTSVQNDPSTLSEMSKLAANVCDGTGAMKITQFLSEG